MVLVLFKLGMSGWSRLRNGHSLNTVKGTAAPETTAPGMRIFFCFTPVHLPIKPGFAPLIISWTRFGFNLWAVKLSGVPANNMGEKRAEIAETVL